MLTLIHVCVSFSLEAAFDFSRNKYAATPYSIHASEEFNLAYNGGKKDDITVVAGIVEYTQDS